MSMPTKRGSQQWLPSIFNDFFGSDFLMRQNATSPAINVFETEKEYIVDVAAPGMKKEDFSIQIDTDNRLVVSTEKHSKPLEEKRYLRQSFGTSTFRQSIIMPEDVDREKISARVDSGILYITLPKLKPEVVKPEVRTIGIA